MILGNMKKILALVLIAIAVSSCTIYDDSGIDTDTYECVLRVQGTGDYHSSYFVSDCSDCFGSYGLDANCQ